MADSREAIDGSVSELLDSMEKRDIPIDWTKIPKIEGVGIQVDDSGVRIEKRAPEYGPPELEVSARHGDLDDCVYVKVILRYRGEYDYVEAAILKISRPRFHRIAEGQQIPIFAPR